MKSIGELFLKGISNVVPIDNDELLFKRNIRIVLGSLSILILSGLKIILFPNEENYRRTLFWLTSSFFFALFLNRRISYQSYLWYFVISSMYKTIDSTIHSKFLKIIFFFPQIQIDSNKKKKKKNDL